MEAQIQELRNELAALAQRNNELDTIILGMRTTNQTTNDALATMGTMMAALPGQMAAAVAAREPKKTLIDVRGLGRPGVFTNNEKDFVNWARRTENYVCSVFPLLRQVLPWACEQDDVATADEAQRESLNHIICCRRQKSWTSRCT